MCAIDVRAAWLMLSQPEHLPFVLMGGVVAAFLAYSAWTRLMRYADQQHPATPRQEPPPQA